MSSFKQQFRPRLLLASAFLTISILIAWDLVSDRGAGADLIHLVIESLILAIATGSALVLFARDWQQRQRLRELSRDLSTAHANSVRWRSRYQETVNGLSHAIRAQFIDWELSNAEAEIALLMLKGLGLKEIAALRDTSERTVREQARAVYRKSGLSNRASLSAYFLEDLLLPIAEDAKSG